MTRERASKNPLTLSLPKGRRANAPDIVQNINRRREPLPTPREPG